MREDVLKENGEFWVGTTRLNELCDDSLSALNGYLIFCMNGSAVVEVNLHTYSLKRNMFVVLSPSDAIRISSRSEDFMTYSLVCSTDFLREACTQLERVVFPYIHENFNIVIEREEQLRGIMNLFDMLKTIFTEKESLVRREIMLLQLRCFFLSIYDRAKRLDQQNGVTEEHASTRAEYLFKNFLWLVMEHYRESREVLFYSNKLCITPKYLNTIVKGAIQKTAKEVIDKHVILQLQIAVRNSEKSFQELSYEYNFPNQSYFGRYFRKLTGVSPTDYRRGNVASTQG